MPHVSRGLIALLAATVVLAALWVVALKPGGSSGSGSGSQAQGLGAYQHAINAAHGAVQISAADNARAGADPTSPPASAPPGSHPAATAHPAARAHVAARSGPHARSKPVHLPTTHTPAGRLAAVEHALSSHKVVALLFYNPAAPDDRAVDQELKGVPTHGGKVFKLAVPLNEIVNYTALTNEVPVNLSPTLVLVAPNHQVDEIVGYTDPFEISQRVDQALALK